MSPGFIRYEKQILLSSKGYASRRIEHLSSWPAYRWRDSFLDEDSEDESFNDNNESGSDQDGSEEGEDDSEDNIDDDKIDREEMANLIGKKAAPKKKEKKWFCSDNIKIKFVS